MSPAEIKMIIEIIMWAYEQGVFDAIFEIFKKSDKHDKESKGSVVFTPEFVKGFASAAEAANKYGSKVKTDEFRKKLEKQVFDSGILEKIKDIGNLKEKEKKNIIKLTPDIMPPIKGYDY